MGPFATLFTALTLTFSCANAEVRRDDEYLWRRARTLKSGEKVFAVETSFQNFSDRYADDGRVQPLGQPFARKLTWNRLKAGADARATEAINTHLRENKLSGEEVAATSTYDVTRQEVGFGLNLAYGLTESWMVGLLVPFRFVTLRTHQDIEPVGNMTPAMRDSVKQLASSDLTGVGYDQVPEQRQSWEFGDVSLLNQFELARSYRWIWSLQQQVRFPTARSQSVSEYISSTEDEGSVNLGLTSLLDYRWKRGVAGLRFGYMAQLPDSVRMRGPTGTSVDSKVNRDLGDWMFGALDTEVRVVRRLSVSAEHSVLYKNRDRYSGESFNPEVYEAMSAQTDQQMQQSRLGMLYRIGSTGNRVGERWMATVDYTYPWIGRNSAEAAKTSLELINYF